MDAMIQQTINGYTSVFDTLPVSDPALQAEIAAFRKELDTLGESSADVMAFMTGMQSGSISERYSDLIARASAPPAPAAGGETQAPSGGGNLPTVSAFLGQFRASYDEVKKAGYRKRAERAYEAIFAVADRTDDLLEMNIILEQEGLLWKIVSEDLLDIYEPFLEAADPLNTAFVSQFTRLVAACRDSRSDEELAWRTDRAVQENQQETFRFMTRMTAAVMLSGAIMGYERCKRAFQSWLEPEKDLRALIAQREAARRTHEFLARTWGWDFDAMVADEWMKTWMLVPSNADALGRIRRVLDPHNLEAMRALLFEEILSEKSLAEIMLQEQPQALYYLLNNRENEVAARHAEEANKRNAHLTWFQYQDRLQAAAGDKLVKQPESKPPGR